MTHPSKSFLAARAGLSKGLRTFLWLASIMVPVSLLVTLLQHYGVVAFLAELMESPFRAIGLPGSSALVVVSSLFLNLYSAIGVMLGLGLSLRAMSILAVVCLIAHNYLVELVITKKTGTPVLRMLFVRTATAFLAGFLLNLILPESLGAVDQSAYAATSGGGVESLREALGAWLLQAGRLMGKVFLIVMALMTFVSFMQRYGVTEAIAGRLAPVMRLFGLPENVAFLWLVSNTLGLAYGAGVLMEEVKEGRLTAADGDLLNHHLSISHSLLEDSLLFVALGIPALLLIVPRLLLAVVAVWERRLERAALRKVKYRLLTDKS